MDIYNEIKEMLVNAAAVEEEVVVPEAHLQDDLGVDSLALVYIAEAIAKRHGIELQSDDLVDLENVNELVKLVESRISSKP